MKKFHCFFEQSGTFKNEFKKLGYDAYDYDILNDFNETDFQIDLFEEIKKSYEDRESIFDKMSSDRDTILAFFPCIRFEAQILLHFRGQMHSIQDWTDEKKLEYDLKLHQELHDLYNLITKLTIVCIRKKIPLIIENPSSEQHYLTRYWCLKSKVVDNDRRRNGDYQNKPTQYWFINCEPKDNFIFEPIEYVEKKTHNDMHPENGKSVKVLRSMIHPQYANRFIKEFILDLDELKE